MTKRKQQTDKPKKMVYVGPEPEKPKKKKRGGCSTSLFVIAIVLFAVYIFDSDDDDRNTTRPEPTVSFSSQQSTSRPNQTLVPTILLTNTPLATELALEITPTINLDATRRAEQNFIILTQMASAPTRTPIPPTRRPTEAPSEFWYTASNANARSCPNRDCDVVTVIETGTRIEVVGQEQGEAVSGNTTWMLVKAGGQIAYVHRSTVSQTRPQPASAPVQQQIQQSAPVVPPVMPAISIPAASGCDCHSGDTLNCSDFSRQADAQACSNKCVSEVGRDVHGLDSPRDTDNIACETLP